MGEKKTWKKEILQNINRSNIQKEEVWVGFVVVFFFFTTLHFQISFTMYSFVCVISHLTNISYVSTVSCAVDIRDRGEPQPSFTLPSSEWTQIIKKKHHRISKMAWMVIASGNDLVTVMKRSVPLALTSWGTALRRCRHSWDRLTQRSLKIWQKGSAVGGKDKAVGAKLRRDPGPRKMLGFLAVVVGPQKTFTRGVITSHIPQKHDSSCRGERGPWS